MAREALAAIPRKRIAPGQGSGKLIWNLYGLETIRRKPVDLITGATKEVRLVSHPGVVSGEVRDTFTAMGNRVAIDVVTPCWEGPTAENLKVSTEQHPEVSRELDTARDLIAGGICIIDDRKVMVIIGSGTTDAVTLFFKNPKVL